MLFILTVQSIWLFISDKVQFDEERHIRMPRPDYFVEARVKNEKEIDQYRNKTGETWEDP